MAVTPPFFAAGLFDGPWIIIAIALISALANWLTKRRQQKQAERESQAEAAPAAETKPKETDWEATLRRLLGEEESTPPAAPPPIPRVRQAPPPPPRTVALVPPIVPAAVSREPAAARVLQPTEPVRETVADFARAHRAQTRGKFVSAWRNPRRAREAFVASLVFAPPKGLEP